MDTTKKIAERNAAGDSKAIAPRQPMIRGLRAFATNVISWIAIFGIGRTVRSLVLFRTLM